MDCEVRIHELYCLLKMLEKLKEYFSAQSTSLLRHALEELLMLCFGWLPGAIGIIVRAPLWRLLIRGSGLPALEKGVIIKNSKWITLEDKVFLDRQVYLHGGKKGLHIGKRTRVMYGAELNVYNFRGLEDSYIEIGDDCVIGPGCVITGQGGVKIGNDVIIGPKVLILPVDHNYENTQELIRNQGLKLDKITISDNVWIGGGAIILAGTTIGEGAVIAGGAIVSRSIPPRSLAAGNPAQIIKQW